MLAGKAAFLPPPQRRGYPAGKRMNTPRVAAGIIMQKEI